MFPDLVMSLVQSFVPSWTQSVDASESALTGLIWLGGIGIIQTENIYIWTLQTFQALYEIDFTVENVTFDKFIQLLSYEVLTGMVHNYLIILCISDIF